ncbi:tRNA lysidine(34) synthetase TilS [Dyella mobilis]|uniref:tRNA lysidine(34) synthetase TilS n=1 Tax=Dyella mobilis TaxID=1849582 RepID=UPI0024E14B10|nr:tRNA lysidine(34) synthetase TilS [Dyella mobilis]
MSSGRSLLDTLHEALAAHPIGPLCVAYSGGPDSTALLHALASMPQARARGLRAIHVDHVLHPESARWAAHCRAFSATLGLTCDIHAAQVDRHGGMGLEAAARHARYSLFARHLHVGERLLLGHHQDDQVETILLKLLRGAGPEGLGGMRAERALGGGTLWRPLLALPRQALGDYVRAHALPSIHDPSNDDTRLARNHLRNDVLPLLKTHWPHATASITHSASLCRAASDALAQNWLGELDSLRDEATNSLAAGAWLALAPALRDPLLSHWLHTQGLPAPTTAQRRQIERQCAAREGQLPLIRWPGAELYVWKNRLWAMAPRRHTTWPEGLSWQGEPLTLPDGGRLTLEPAAARLPAPLRVSTRSGGERIRPAGDRHTRDLRSLFQTGAVPPWQRDACPLLYEGDELIAVADRWLSARAQELFSACGGRPRWHPT